MQEFKKQRPDKGTGHAADSAEHRDQNEMARCRPECEIRNHAADSESGDRAANTREHRRQNISNQQNSPDRNAKIFEAHLIGVNRRQGMTERAIEITMNQKPYQHH